MADLDDKTCLLERSKVREILCGLADEHVHIAEGLLADIDALSIYTADDFAPWHPIDTAPTDGTHVDLCTRHVDGDRYRIPDMVLIDGEVWRYTSGNVLMGTLASTMTPTHWREVPALPVI